MFEIVLYEPEIAPNTGNIMRLCRNNGCRLHLVEPLGFELDEKRLRRAGLDYADWARLECHPSFAALLKRLPQARVFAFTTRGQRAHDRPRYQPGDILLFGPETRGLPEPLLASLPPDQCLRLPMQPGSRSLNLANTVAVASYEAWRQLGFAGAGPRA